MIKKLLLLAVTCFSMTGSALAGNDVTSLLLKNADFSAGPVVETDIFTYGKDMSENGTYGLQAVDGWNIALLGEDPISESYPGSGRCGGVMAYGSSNMLRGNSVSAPATGPDEQSGNCLAFLAVWSLGGYYYQNVSLVPGKYKITVPVYNVSGSSPYESYIGFIGDGGQRFIAEQVAVTGKWTTLSSTFTVSEIVSGKIVLGYQASQYGSSSAPHLFFDQVKIDYTVVGDDDDEVKEDWVDCTSYIQNPSFDEDISFNTDATIAKPVTGTWIWIWNGDESNADRRAIVSVAADGSIYSTGDDQWVGHNKYNVPNWYGFKANIKGWEITNKSDTAIWIYYGSLPYDIEDGTLSLGQGEMGSETVPDKPDEIAVDDNKGVLYLKAGWLNACSYKQTIKNLERAKYRLTYYIRNTNADSYSYAEATNLCNVTCNGVRFVDDEGFNSAGWIKHSIDFIPVDSFSIEFGCMATNNYSYMNPILWVDGIRLYKMESATDEEVDMVYHELVTKAEALLDKIHFAGDRKALQEAMQAFASDKDYSALYQAIQIAMASEEKYAAITANDALIQTIKAALEDNHSAFSNSDKAKALVSYAATKVDEWIASDNATYVDADSRVESLDAYANTYVPVYMEAEHHAATLSASLSEVLQAIMESQSTALTTNGLLEAQIVVEYAEALREAIDNTNNSKKCAAPAITYNNGVISFTCDTENVEFISKITDTDIQEYKQSDIELSATYNITVFARREGYQDSDVITATLCWISDDTDVVVTELTSVSARPVLIQGHDGIIAIMGAADGTQVVVYGTDGSHIGSTISNNSSAIIRSHLKKGAVVIVKVADKATKIVMK